MPIQFENKVNAGHIITAALLVLSGIGAYYNLAKDQHLVRVDVDTLKTDARQNEARIRAVEIAQASQSSDLRSIQVGITRIEAQLEKLNKP